jgi:hypothetical protein
VGTGAVVSSDGASVAPFAPLPETESEQPVASSVTPIAVTAHAARRRAPRTRSSAVTAFRTTVSSPGNVAAFLPPWNGDGVA